jgi:hypothetical protein
VDSFSYPQSSVPALLQNSGLGAIGYRHTVEIRKIDVHHCSKHGIKKVQRYSKRIPSTPPPPKKKVTAVVAFYFPIFFLITKRCNNNCFGHFHYMCTLMWSRMLA